ncbi:MAG TPA: transglutaminase, partial [Gammaproteobacteria bacterium]|nr:transglutaminase [Gammaproteobacteria bacterium]
MKKIRNLILFSLLFFMPATSFAFTLAGIFSDKTSGGSTSRLEAWHTLITSAHTENHWQILNQVNQFINQARYVPDIRQWGEIDYWATPAEFLMSNAGDCEDYAIAKYYTLIAIGIPADKMRLTHVT